MQASSEDEDKKMENLFKFAEHVVIKYIKEMSKELPNLITVDPKLESKTKESTPIVMYVDEEENGNENMAAAKPKMLKFEILVSSSSVNENRVATTTAIPMDSVGVQQIMCMISQSLTFVWQTVVIHFTEQKKMSDILLNVMPVLDTEHLVFNMLHITPIVFEKKMLEENIKLFKSRLESNDEEDTDAIREEYKNSLELSEQKLEELNEKYDLGEIEDALQLDSEITRQLSLIESRIALHISEYIEDEENK